MGLFGLFGGGGDGRRDDRADAEAALMRLERKVDVLLRTLGMEPGQHQPGPRIAVLEAKIDRALAAQGSTPYADEAQPSWMAEVEAEVRANRLIHAIKIYRDYTDQGLKESKDAVHAFQADLRRRGEIRR